MLDASTRIDVLNLLGDLKSRGLGDPLHHARPLARQLHQRPHRDPAPRRAWSRWARPSASSATRFTRTRRTLLASVPQLHTKWDATSRRRPRARATRRRAARRRSRTTTSSRPCRRACSVDAPRIGERRRRGIPWEERPAGSSDVVWRSSRNPIIPRDLIPRANSIFNSAVVPFGDGFAGVFRVDDTRRVMNLHAGRSADGDRLADRRTSRSRSSRRTSACPRSQEPFEHAYDPRVTLARRPLLRHVVQRLPRPDDRRRLHARLRDVPPARQRVPAVQPQRRALPAPDRRQLRDAQPPERQRPHAVRRHLLLGEPRPRALGPPPARAGAASRGRGSRPRSAPARRRSRPTKAGCSLYHGVLTSLQRLRLLDGRRAARPRRAVAVIAPRRATTCSRRRCPTSRSAMSRTSSSRAPRSSTARPTGSTIYYGAADTVVCLAHGHLSELLAFVRE